MSASTTGTPAEPVPVAFLGRTSTLLLQDPASSLSRQLRGVRAKLPPGWFIAAHSWDIESGGMDLDFRSRGGAHAEAAVTVPRDGGVADLLAEAASTAPRFAVVMVEDIKRSARDFYASLSLERRLDAAGIPLLATDEPLSVDGMNSTSVLVRRVKQGVAEWYRLALREKTKKGFIEHTLAGYNIGTPPYGYLAVKIPHPVPVKAAEGKSKTLLELDPPRARVVAQIYEWRVISRLGVRAITLKLRADPGAYPPPTGKGWVEPTVAGILANPKYTGHMVFGRTRRTGGRRGVPAPRSEWIWTPEPVHPAIITRQVWEEAQAAGAAHRSADDTPGMSSQPHARRVYPFRSMIFCRDCGRRLGGTTRQSRTKRGKNEYPTYRCSHNPDHPGQAARYPDHPGQAARYPDHPATVQIRQDKLTAIVADFFDTRIFGPERAALLAAALPGTDADAERQRQDRIEAWKLRLKQIDTAERGLTIELEQIRAEQEQDPAAPAPRAMRTRIVEQFTELEAERARIGDDLAAITRTAPAPANPALLDTLPHLAGYLANATRKSSGSYTRRSGSRSCGTRPTTRSASTPPSPAQPPAPSPPSSPTVSHQHPPPPPTPPPQPGPRRTSQRTGPRCAHLHMSLERTFLLPGAAAGAGRGARRGWCSRRASAP